MQEDSFPIEVQALQKGLPLPSTSPVLRLCPFMDEDGLLRVGGQLQELHAEQDIRHPILL